MKRTDLLNALETTKMCLSNHPLIPILGHFCFDKDTVTTFNGTQGVVTIFDSQLQCAIPGEVFYKLISSYLVEDIDIFQKDKLVIVQAGENDAKLATLPKTDFVFELPNVEGLPSFNLTDDLLTGFDKVLMSVSDNPMERNLFGVTMVNGTNTILYASDIKTLSKYEVPNPILDQSFTLLLPKLFVGLLIVFGKVYEENEFFIGPDFVYVDFGPTILYSKIFTDIDFLDYESEINKFYLSSLKFQKRPLQLLPALDRALIFLSQEIDPIVNFTLDGDLLELFTQSAYGDVRDEVAIENIWDAFSFRMDAKALQNGLVATNEISFSQTGGYGIFVGRDLQFLHMILSQMEK